MLLFSFYNLLKIQKPLFSSGTVQEQVWPMGCQPCSTINQRHGVFQARKNNKK